MNHLSSGATSLVCVTDWQAEQRIATPALPLGVGNIGPILRLTLETGGQAVERTQLARIHARREFLIHGAGGFEGFSEEGWMSA